MFVFLYLHLLSLLVNSVVFKFIENFSLDVVLKDMWSNDEDVSNFLKSFFYCFCLNKMFKAKLLNPRIF